MQFIFNKCKLYFFQLCVLIAFIISLVLDNSIPNYKEFSQTMFFVNITNVIVVNYLSVLNEMHSYFYDYILVYKEYNQNLFWLRYLLLWLVSLALAAFLILFISVVSASVLYLFYFTFISLFDEVIEFYCIRLDKLNPHIFESAFRDSDYLSILLKELLLLPKQWELFAITNFKSSFIVCIAQAFFFVFLFPDFVKVMFVVLYILTLYSLLLAYFYFFFKNLNLYYSKNPICTDTSVKATAKKTRVSRYFTNLKLILFNITFRKTKLKSMYYLLALAHYILSALVLFGVFILFCFILLYLWFKSFSYKFSYSYSPIVFNVLLLFYCFTIIFLVLYSRNILIVKLNHTRCSNFQIIFCIIFILIFCFFYIL